MLTASYINRLCQFGREEYDLCIFDDSGVEIRRFNKRFHEGVTLTGTPTVTCESIGSVVDPAPASFIVDATLVGSNIDIAVAGQVQGADYEIRVTSATTNPLLTLTRVGRIYVF